MKAFLAVLVLLVALGRADGQTYDPTSATRLKLTGITLKATPEGYFVLSIPLEDIPKALRIIAHFEPHMDVIEMVARVSSSAVRVHRVVSHTPEVPNGLVFLASAEVFPVRHKIIDRYVTQIGFCHFTNSRGKIAEVPDYMGGPMPR